MPTQPVTDLSRLRSIPQSLISGQLSQNTSRAYAQDIADFLAFIGGETRLPVVTKESITDYRSYLVKDKAYRPATVNRKLSVVRQLFAEAVDRGVVQANPAARVKGIKQDSTFSPTQGLTREQAKLLLDSIERETLKGKRDFAMLSLMIRTGLRRAEVASLVVQDIGKREGHDVLTVTGKGNKRRLIKLPVDVCRAMEDWLSYRGDIGPDSPLFAEVRKLGRGAASEYKVSAASLTCDGLWHIIRRRVDKAGVKANITPHSLRHTFITLALAGGAPLHKVQYAAGHADPRTTERYDRQRDNLDDNAVDYIRL
jgi:site-specific recombinase XerD